MKIAMIGTRGIPAKYGGFETCAEELGKGLVARGHRVLVSCRRNLYPCREAFYKGVRLCYPPSIPGKATDTFSHSFFSLCRVLAWSPDIILIFNSANSPIGLLARIAGKKVVINVDGLEWRRSKWGRAAKLYYKFAEFFSAVIADAVVSDARGIQDYYRRKYNRDSVFIPYGAPLNIKGSPEILREYRLKKDSFFFIGSRLEPENHQDMAVRAFEEMDTAKELVIAGGANWKSPYVYNIKKSRDSRLRFLGPVYREGHIETLHANAFAYIHGNEVGGTNPALLKAMGSGNAIIALDVNFNREVLGDSGLYFSEVSGLKKQMELLLASPAKVAELRKAARERAEKLYRWTTVIDDYEKLFLEEVG